VGMMLVQGSGTLKRHDSKASTCSSSGTLFANVLIWDFPALRLPHPSPRICAAEIENNDALRLATNLFLLRLVTQVQEVGPQPRVQILVPHGCDSLTRASLY
jgi:hypothetical protein